MHAPIEQITLHSLNGKRTTPTEFQQLLMMRSAIPLSNEARKLHAKITKKKLAWQRALIVAQNASKHCKSEPENWQARAKYLREMDLKHLKNKSGHFIIFNFCVPTLLPRWFFQYNTFGTKIWLFSPQNLVKRFWRHCIQTTFRPKSKHNWYKRLLPESIKPDWPKKKCKKLPGIEKFDNRTKNYTCPKNHKQ